MRALSRFMCEKGIRNFDMHMYFNAGMRAGVGNAQSGSLAWPECGGKLRGWMWFPSGFARATGPFTHEILHRFISGQDMTFDSKLNWALRDDGSREQTSHWMFTVLDTQGQLGGYASWGVFCKTNSGDYKMVYPNPSICVKNRAGKYDMYYLGKAGSPTTSHDSIGISEYELVMMGLKDISTLNHVGIIGVEALPNKSVRAVPATEDILLQLPGEHCKSVGFVAKVNEDGENVGGCKTAAELRDYFPNLMQMHPHACKAETCYHDSRSRCPRGSTGRNNNCMCWSGRKLWMCRPWSKPTRGSMYPMTASSINIMKNADVSNYIRNSESLKAKQWSTSKTFKIAPIAILPRGSTPSGASKVIDAMSEMMARRPEKISEMTNGLFKVSTGVTSSDLPRAEDEVSESDDFDIDDEDNQEWFKNDDSEDQNDGEDSDEEFFEEYQREEEVGEEFEALTEEDIETALDLLKNLYK